MSHFLFNRFNFSRWQGGGREFSLGKGTILVLPWVQVLHITLSLCDVYNVKLLEHNVLSAGEFTPQENNENSVLSMYRNPAKFV